MTWDEIDFDRKMWIIPAEKMKMKRAHLVPLSCQAIGILREIASLHGQKGLVFPGTKPGKPLSANTIRSAIFTMGFAKEEMSGHGFRGTASTLLNELGYNSEHVDMQLAHWTGDVSKTYNHAKYLQPRRDMLQDWADYLDGIKEKYAARSEY